MKPLIEHVKPLEKFDAKAFANWLCRGFSDISSPDDEVDSKKHLDAFAPLNYFVQRRGDLTAELKDIHDLLSYSAKSQFNRGIAIAFSKLAPKQHSISLARQLLHLAGRVNATEIIPKLIPQIGNGFFGMPSQQEGKELFALTIDIVAGMSPGYHASDCLENLIHSSFFLPEYAPMAFIGLCRAKPDQFPVHLEKLQSDFNALHKKQAAENTHITARRLVHYVPLNVIAKHLYSLEFATESSINDNDNDNDNWLVDALFLGERAPLGLEYNQQGYHLFRFDLIANQASKSHQIVSKENRPLESYLEHILQQTTAFQQLKLPAQQKNWPDFIKKLRPHLATLRGINSDALELRAFRLVERVGVQTISDQLWRIDPQQDTWLLKALIGEEASPLRALRDENNQWWLFRQQDFLNTGSHCRVNVSTLDESSQKLLQRKLLLFTRRLGCIDLAASFSTALQHSDNKAQLFTTLLHRLQKTFPRGEAVHAIAQNLLNKEASDRTKDYFIDRVLPAHHRKIKLEPESRALLIVIDQLARDKISLSISDLRALSVQLQGVEGMDFEINQQLYKQFKAISSPSFDKYMHHLMDANLVLGTHEIRSSDFFLLAQDGGLFDTRNSKLSDEAFSKIKDYLNPSDQSGKPAKNTDLKAVDESEELEFIPNEVGESKLTGEIRAHVAA